MGLCNKDHHLDPLSFGGNSSICHPLQCWYCFIYYLSQGTVSGISTWLFLPPELRSMGQKPNVRFCQVLSKSIQNVCVGAKEMTTTCVCTPNYGSSDQEKRWGQIPEGKPCLVRLLLCLTLLWSFLESRRRGTQSFCGSRGFRRT